MPVAGDCGFPQQCDLARSQGLHVRRGLRVPVASRCGGPDHHGRYGSVRVLQVRGRPLVPVVVVVAGLVVWQTAAVVYVRD